MNVTLILFAYFTLFVFGLIDNSRGPTYPDILSFFQLSKSSGSLIFSLSSGFAFLLTLNSNRIFRKFGINNSVKIAIFLMVLSPVVYGYFGRSLDGYYGFLLGSIILGTSVGILSVGINLILAKNSNKNNNQKLFSGLHSMYGLASFAAPLLLSFILGLGFSWQNYYFILAAFPLLLFLCTFKIKNQSFSDTQTSSLGLTKTVTIPLGILFSFYVCSEIILSTRLVVYLTEYQGLSQSFSTQALSVFFFLLLVGRMSFAFITTRISSLFLLKCSSLLTIVFIVLGMNVSPYLLPITGLTMSFFFPCAMGWLSNKYPEHNDTLIPTVMKYVNGMIVVIHGVFGVISDSYGLQVAFYLAVGFQLVVLYLLHKQR
jgi:fucose permease